MVATHFSGNAINIGVLEDFEKNNFLENTVELLPARFQGPPKMGVTSFCLVFSSFSVSSASSKRVLKKTIFIGFFAHPSKASSDIMQQQSSKA